MSKPVIEIKNISKAYFIGHEAKANPGTITLRDAMVGVAKKPIELLTGHRLKKERFWALKDINLEINQGDVVGLIGKNGSGKSTLLKVLSRIVDPTKGEIIMRGRSASLLEVGTGFHPELTGRENVYFNGSILGMKKKEIEAKFDEIVAFSEVEKFLDTPVKFYSSGMYVRLAFAVAAHLDPDILIVDEVLAVGDAAFQKKCLGKMQDVAGEGRTVIFVSHNMDAVRSLCNKGVFLKDGNVELGINNISKVIDAYLLSGNKISNQPFWKRREKIDNTKEVEALELSLLDERNKVITATIDRQKKYQVSLKLQINNPVAELMFGYALYDEEGKTLFWSFPTDSDPAKLDGLIKGKFNITSILPVNELNPGTYRLEFISTIYNKKWIDAPQNDNPSIQFVVAGKMSNSLLYSNPRPGLIAPVIPWNARIEKNSDD